jgi:peptidoglycan/xylan/chitin deacetylase (PgdA/CDA1 family)
MKAVLTYHSIDGSGSPISIDSSVFRRHVTWLASGRVRVVPLEQLLRPAHDERDAVALTFDDGFVNFATEAAPVLRDHALPATVFVVSGHAGRTNAWGGREQRGVPTLPLLDWEALAALAEDGFSLGAHGRTHRPLDILGDAEVEEELGSCAAELRSRTGRRPATFAYPYGRTSAVAIAAARAHFMLSCTTELRPLSCAEDPARIPRLDTYYLRAPGRLEGWGSTQLIRYLWVRSQVRRVRLSLGTVAARL